MLISKIQLSSHASSEATTVKPTAWSSSAWLPPIKTKSSITQRWSLRPLRRSEFRLTFCRWILPSPLQESLCFSVFSFTSRFLTTCQKPQLSSQQCSVISSPRILNFQTPQRILSAIGSNWLAPPISQSSRSKCVLNLTRVLRSPSDSNHVSLPSSRVKLSSPTRRRVTSRQPLWSSS